MGKINKMMWVSKVPNYDAYGLFRALHFHNPPQYSHIVGLSSHFFAHRWMKDLGTRPDMSIKVG